MLDDADNDAPELDQPNADRVYRNYLATCRRLGVTGVPRERAKALIAEWTDTQARCGAIPRTTR